MKESHVRPTDRTDELVARMKDVLAYGGRHTLMLRPLYEDEEGVFPELAAEASGYELTDSRGRTYLDWLSAWGPVLLGYRHPEVEEAIIDQLRAGPMTSLAHPVEVEVASMLTDMVPCAEMVAFGKNGSDAATAAVRVARAATGREMILQFGLHGFHDWYTCQFRAHNSKGVPKVLRSFVQPFPYNDLTELERLFHRYPGEIAAVVMEPVQIVDPEPGYLEGVRDLAHHNGALLVFDEMVTGFRLANGGAQERYGVVPDLACFGKGLANGMPLSAVVGAREYMRHLPSTAYGMTFRGETLSLAAAAAVLRVLQREPVAEHLARIGNDLRREFHRTCREAGVACQLLGPPARMTFVFDEVAGISPEVLRQKFVLECARNGVLTRAGVMPSYAHDDDAVRRTVPALEAALRTIGETIRHARGQVAAAMTGGFADAVAAAESNGDPLPGKGNIDRVVDQGVALLVEGWLLCADGPPDAIEFEAPDSSVLVADAVQRPDLEVAFPQIAGAAAAGWRASLPAGVFAPGGDFEFVMRARRGEQVVFERSVVRRAKRTASKAGASLAEDGTLQL